MDQMHVEQTGSSEFGAWSVLAQAAPPLAGGKGEAAPAAAGTTTGATADGAGTTVAPGGGAGAGAPAPGMGGFGMLWPFFLVLLFMIGFSWWAQSKDKKRRAAMLSSIGRSDRVQTAGGIIGTVVELRDDEVVLRVDEATNTKITFSKHAVQGVVKKAHSGAEAAAA